MELLLGFGFGKEDIVDEVDGSRHQLGMGHRMWMNDDSGLRDSPTGFFTVRTGTYVYGN